nr:tigger transposable element-derived protein 4-like [Crassostrea gigas]
MMVLVGKITVALCASMCGEKVKTLLIAKSRNPRCFKKIKPETLPVSYYFNKKSWMNSEIMEAWLKGLDRKMGRQNRKILLFLDNAPSHPKIELRNIELKNFPGNTTSHTQPMDMGITQTTKLKFRRKQMQYILTQMDKQPGVGGTELLRQINILDTVKLD